MRTFLFISKQGDGWALAERLNKEGERAVVYINEEDKRSVGDGIVEKSTVRDVLITRDGSISKITLIDLLDLNPDCVVFDMVGQGYGKVADQIRKKGIPVVGGSEWGDRVELDRVYGNKIMKAYKINTPPTYAFNDYKKAIQFVKEKGIPFVYKPSQNQPTFTTYVSRGVEDMIGILNHYSNISQEFELQERVDGIEVSTELWFNGTTVVNVNHTMEKKHLMNDNIGPRTGCSGSVVWVGSKNERLYKEGIGKIVPGLKKIGYRGPLDLNTIVTKDTLYGLEWTARFGYDAFFIFLEMYKGRLSDLLYGIAKGTLDFIGFISQWGMGVDIFVPPYPMDECPSIYKDVLIQGVNNANLKHIWFYDVYKRNGKYLISGNGGNIGVVTARGDSVEPYSPIRDAKRRIMRTISNLVIPDLMYRTDIGSDILTQRQTLKDWGWI